MANFKGFIYKITNIQNAHSYIGKTNNIIRRWKEHKSGRGGTSILGHAICKYGINNFKFEVIREISCYSLYSLNRTLSVLETYYINHYNTHKNGYNATIGGEGVISLNKAIYKRAAEKRKGIRRSKEAILATATKISKPVLQYSLDGDFIQEHPRISTIENTNVSQLIACCKGKLNSAYGYIWRYKTCSEYPHKIKAAENYHISNLKILQYSKEGKKIAEYNSITEAARLTNIIRTGIGNCLKGWSKSAGGYLWKYKKDELLDNK